MKRTSESQIRHLSQAVQLEEAVNPAIIRTTMMTIGISILAFTAWAGFTNINEVARTPGEIVPNGYQQVVQHLEGGIVREIDVSEGDVVKKGEKLILLDGAGFAEDLERAKARKISLSMQEERLRAYLEKRDPDFSRFTTTDKAQIRDQQSFFKSMENTNNEERKVVQEQITQKRRVIGSLQSELKTAQGNLAISQQLFDSRKELYGKGFLSETKYLEAQQALNNIRGEISQIQSRLSVARNRGAPAVELLLRQAIAAQRVVAADQPVRHRQHDRLLAACDPSGVGHRQIRHAEDAPIRQCHDPRACGLFHEHCSVLPSRSASSGRKHIMRG